MRSLKNIGLILAFSSTTLLHATELDSFSESLALTKSTESEWKFFSEDERSKTDGRLPSIQDGVKVGPSSHSEIPRAMEISELAIPKHGRGVSHAAQGSGEVEIEPSIEHLHPQMKRERQPSQAEENRSSSQVRTRDSRHHVGRRHAVLHTSRERTYRNCEVLKADPDGLTFRHDRGIAKVSFAELEVSIREAYGFSEKSSSEFVARHQIKSQYHPGSIRRGSYNLPSNLLKARPAIYPGYGITSGFRFRDPATPFYNSAYSNLSIADQLRQQHFSNHAIQTYGGATIKSNTFGPRYLGYIPNQYPRQIGTFSSGPSGGSLSAPVRSGFSAGGPIAPSLAPAAR